MVYVSISSLVLVSAYPVAIATCHILYVFQIGRKYQTWFDIYDWIESKSEAKKSESVAIVHHAIFCGIGQL